MQLTVPNALTLFRIVMVPIMVIAFYLPYRFSNLLAAVLFTIGALTDWLDGFIARRWQQYSAFGAFLDPVADKITVCFALFLIVQADPTWYMAVTGAVIVGREITISALREWMAEIGQRTHVRVRGMGKFKTALQMVAIIILLLQHRYAGRPLYEFGQYLLMIAAAITLWSGFVYLRAAWPLMRAEGRASSTPSPASVDSE